MGKLNLAHCSLSPLFLALPLADGTKKKRFFLLRLLLLLFSSLKPAPCTHSSVMLRGHSYDPQQDITLVPSHLDSPCWEVSVSPARLWLEKNQNLVPNPNFLLCETKRCKAQTVQPTQLEPPAVLVSGKVVVLYFTLGCVSLRSRAPHLGRARS